VTPEASAPLTSGTPKPTPTPINPTHASSHDIPGYDIPAPDGKTPYTKWCGSLRVDQKMGWLHYDECQLTCDKTPGCVAFVYALDERCCYMKTRGTRDVVKPDDNFQVLTSQEKPQKPCSFVPTGSPCITDPWVEQPVCCSQGTCANGKCQSGFTSSALRQYRLMPL